MKIKTLYKTLMVLLSIALLTYGQLSYKYDSPFIMITLFVFCVVTIDVLVCLKDKQREMAVRTLKSNR